MVSLVVLAVPFANEARRKTGRKVGCNELIIGSLDVEEQELPDSRTKI
jgi:hypothetical protein